MSDATQAIVLVKTVRYACELELARVDAYRKREFQLAADREMTHRRWSGWTRGWTYPATYAEAEQRAKDLTPWTATWRIGSWGSKGTAERLLAACDISTSNVIMLDSSDAMTIREWLKKEEKDDESH